MDNSKEGLMFQHKKPSFSSSFDPISEKQEEMSISSIPGNNQPKNKNSKDMLTKNILDDADIIRHSQTTKNKNSWITSGQRQNNFLPQIKEKEKEENKIENEQHNIRSSINKTFKRKQTKRKSKRNSVQDGGFPMSNLSLGQFNNSGLKDNIKKKGSLNKQGNLIIGNSYLINKSLHNPENSFSKQYSNAKSISNAVFEMQYMNKTKKKTVLYKGKLDFNDKAETNIFDQIKNSDLYEKSENLLFKLKICYAILAIFSLICIILNCSDAIIYNNKSLEYIYKENNGTYILYRNNVESYYCINKRKITTKENSIRLFNGIFSLICVIILIIIYYIKHGTGLNKKKITKRERFKKMLEQYYNKQRKKSLARNKLRQEEERLKNEKIKVVNLDPDNKDLKDEVSAINDRNKTIRMCIINIIFYPPYINKAFIGKFNNIIYIYSLNSIFLIVSLYKIFNLYRSILFLSSINNSFNKAICKSNLIVLDFKFLFKYSLNKFPLTFLILNLILIFITICMLLSSVEFFSLDTSNNFFNNNIENKAENFFNLSSTFFFFILRNIHEAHCIKSFLGKFLLYSGGILGMLISSFFIYYLINRIEFTPEEHSAFSKLTKLLNPINKEHKASNLIKSLLILKKIFKDNQNTEKDYRLKLEDFKKPSNNQRRPIYSKENNFQFHFNSNGTSNNLINMNEIFDNEIEEKKKYIKFLISIFLFKVKFSVETKNFIDNLKIARNSSQSFNDVLKTIGNKMDANINQLNNKLEILIQNDQKFLNFIKFTTNIMRSIKSINNYHNSLLQHLVEVHNEYVKQMIELRKEVELKCPILYKNSTIFPKRMKSNAYGSKHLKNRVQSKIVNDFNYKKKKSKKDMFDFNYGKFTVKKQKSSMVFSKYLQSNILEEKMRQERSKQNTTKPKRISTKGKYYKCKSEKRTKSLDDWKFIKNELKEKLKTRNSLVKKVPRSVSVIDKNKKRKYTE